MPENLYLVSLNEVQRAQCKQLFGNRVETSHAVVAGSYGQIFGTEKQMRKYYDVWCKIFHLLWKECKEIDSYEFDSFNGTVGLVDKLFEAHDPLARQPRLIELNMNEKEYQAMISGDDLKGYSGKPGCLALLFGKGKMKVSHSWEEPHGGKKK